MRFGARVEKMGSFDLPNWRKASDFRCFLKFSILFLLAPALMVFFLTEEATANADRLHFRIEFGTNPARIIAIKGDGNLTDSNSNQPTAQFVTAEVASIERLARQFLATTSKSQPLKKLRCLDPVKIQIASDAEGVRCRERMSRKEKELLLQLVRKLTDRVT